MSRSRPQPLRGPLALALVALGGCHAATPPPPRGRGAVFTEEVRLLRRMVDAWWVDRAAHEAADGVDVGATFARLEARVATVTTEAGYAVALREALASLGDGHLRLKDAASLRTRALASGVELVGVREGVAVAAAPGGSAAVGDRVVAIDGAPVDGYLAGVPLVPGSTPAQRRLHLLQQVARQERLPGESPAPARLTVEGADGARRELTLAWTAASTASAPGYCVRGRMLDASTGYVDLATFTCATVERFERELRDAVRAVGGAARVVVDLRRNDGGADYLAALALPAFVRRPTRWNFYRRREPYADPPGASVQHWTASPARDPADRVEAPLRLLIGPGCFSMCEVFAAAMQRQPGVELVGEATAGGASAPLEFRLPYSGFVVRIPGVEGLWPTDPARLIETHPVAPDVEVRATADDVRRGRDAVLLAATAPGPQVAADREAVGGESPVRP
jgi:C-terminal processing protease CtpA/Prc